jgi:hypothetical protein
MRSEDDHFSDLPVRAQLELARPDLSAREATNLIRVHSPVGLVDLPVLLIGIAGASSVRGRLNPAVGVWDVRFALPGRGGRIGVSLSARGGLNFQRTHHLWGDGSPTFLLEDYWIDSTAAAEVALEVPVPEGMPMYDAVFMKMRKDDTVGLFWELFRTAFNPPTHYSHTLIVSATTGAIVAEIFERKHAGTVVESRYRSRLDSVGQWISR